MSFLRKAGWAIVMSAALATGSASASLIVSGDSNIANAVTANAGNQAFFSNIVEGTRVVVQNSTRTFLSTQGATLVNFYNGAGFAASLLDAAASVTAADLAGADLFIAYAPDDGFSAGEVSVLQSFLAAGHNVLVTAENSNFPDLIALVNVLLADLGSAMSVVSGLDAAGFHAATPQGPSAYLAGTAGLTYAASSFVSGGFGLFGTEATNTTFVAFENGRAVPEPASLALVLGALGLLAAARRAQPFRG